MKKLVFTVLFVMGALSITFIYSCKKKEGDTVDANTYSVSDNTTFNDDANFYKSENDQLNSDINADVTGTPGIGQRNGEGGATFQSYLLPCGSSVTQVGPKKLSYHFDGTTNCNGRKRSGTVTVELTSGTHWTDVGAVLTFATTDFKVTRWDGKSITFSGTKTLKNVNGSNLADLALYLQGLKTVKVQERAIGVTITFNNGDHATWNTAYTGEYNFTPNDSITYLTVNGDTNLVYSNVGAWGVNRFGKQFYTHYDSPVVWNSHCNSWEPLSGVATHNVDNSELTLTLGVDANGVHQNYTAKNCPWGYKASWHLGNGNNGTANIQYY